MDREQLEQTVREMWASEQFTVGQVLVATVYFCDEIGSPTLCDTIPGQFVELAGMVRFLADSAAVKAEQECAEVERLRDELSRAAGLAMALMAHVPDDLLVGNLRPRALAFCREWGELQGHVDGVRAAVLAEREACAAICDARSRMHNASGIVHTHSDQVRYLEARRIAELIRERS